MSTTHSPPRSQEVIEDQIMTDNPPMSHAVLDTSATGLVQSNASETTRSSPINTAINGKEPVDHGKPGSTWNTKKFREEYDRAFESLLDKKWSMSKYGDPLIRE